MARAVEAFGGVDILVNNAGGPPPGDHAPARLVPRRERRATWPAMFELNLFAAVRAVRAAIPLMLERGGGAIVNVSSGNARQPSPMNVDYGAAKAALSNLTQALSEEFAPQGIRVNTVSPGPGAHAVVDRRGRRRPTSSPRRRGRTARRALRRSRRR